jgi:hypothetical protein
LLLALVSHFDSRCLSKQSQGDEPTQNLAVFVLMNFCTNNPAVWREIVAVGGLPTLFVLGSSSSNIEAQTRASQELLVLSDVEEIQQQMLATEQRLTVGTEDKDR